MFARPRLVFHRPATASRFIVREKRDGRIAFICEDPMHDTVEFSLTPGEARQVRDWLEDGG